MILKNLVAFASLFVLSSALVAVEPIPFDPVGYVKIGNTKGDGAPAVSAFTDVRLSIPLEAKSVLATQIRGVSGKTLSLTNSKDLSEDALSPASGTTYGFVVTTGPEKGLRGLISGNGIDSINVIPTSPGKLEELKMGDRIEIHKSWTLKSFFASSEIPPGVQAFFYNGDVAGINLGPSAIAVWSGSNWIYIFGSPDPFNKSADKLILHSGESFVLRTGPQPIASLTIFGEIPMGGHRMAIEKLSGIFGQDTNFGYFGAVPELIGDSKLGFAPGDQLLVFDPSHSGLNKAVSKILIYSGSRWYGIFGISGDVTNTFALKPGDGYVYRQSPLTSIGEIDWKDMPSYMESP